VLPSHLAGFKGLTSKRTKRTEGERRKGKGGEKECTRMGREGAMGKMRTCRYADVWIFEVVKCRC